jgi:hypothetical protein
MTTISWFDLSKVADGTRVVFEQPHDIFPECVVPAGTHGTVVHNYLNEMQQSISVLPDDERLRTALRNWDGEIILGTHLNSGADLEADPPDDEAAAWFARSPLAVLP